jgi:hypothetical protein
MAADLDCTAAQVSFVTLNETNCIHLSPTGHLQFKILCLAVMPGCHVTDVRCKRGGAQQVYEHRNTRKGFFLHISGSEFSRQLLFAPETPAQPLLGS